MKKKYILFLIAIVLFFKIDFCKSYTYDCAYEVEFGSTINTFTLTFDTEKKTIKMGNVGEKGSKLSRAGSLSDIDELVINSDETLVESKDELLKELKQKLFAGKCDNTLLVFRYWSNGAQHHYWRILFNDTLEANAREYMKGGFGSGTFKDLTSSWASFDKKNSTADDENIFYTCEVYKNYFKKIEDIKENMDNCTESCHLNYSEYTRVKEKVKLFCSIQFKYLDYGASCLNNCLSFEEQIKDLGIEDLKKNMTCGFSGKLILWIANIVKWIKYIVPIIVIVLEILDFIKAIGNGKEDEMKKAQGNFVKRLIAAALIFIVPFIIEFVLNKMGFDANGCGIIDL